MAPPLRIARGAQHAKTDASEDVLSGNYAIAQLTAEETVVRVEAEHGPESVETARALDSLVQALVDNGKASAPRTLVLAERALSLKERNVGGSELDVAVSLDNLGAVHAERGEFKQALSFHVRALSIRRREIPGAEAVADSLDLAALSMTYLERFRDAKSAIDESLRIRETQPDNLPLPLARTLRIAALVHRYDGNYAAALQILNRALEIRHRLSPEDPETALAMQLQGDLSFLTGDISAARETWSGVLTSEVRILGPEHPRLVAVERRLALAARAFGDRAEERRFLEGGLHVAERSLAPCSLEFPILLGDLASFLVYDGDYGRAQKLYERARSAHETCFGANSTETATVIHNQANLAARIGDFAQAERFHERAIAVWTNALGGNHPYVARGLDALAEVLATRGDSRRALALYQRALLIRRGAFGDEHPDVAWTMVNLARVSFKSGNLAEARGYVDRAIDIYHRVGVSDEPDHLALVLELRARIEERLGTYAVARATLEEALTAREKIFGKEHTLAATTRAEIATVDFVLGFDERSLDAALSAERVGREHLRSTIRYLPERQALAYTERRPKGLDLALSLLAAGRTSERALVFDNVIRARSVILDELAARARSTSAVDPETAVLTASLIGARQRFANLMLRSSGEGEPVPRSMFEAARQQKEDAERALAERSAAFRDELARRELGLSEVRAALPDQAALIAFVEFDRTIVNDRKSSNLRVSLGEEPLRRDRRPSYIAFVARSATDDVSVVPLGQAADIDNLVAEWRRETIGVVEATSAADAERSYRAMGAALRRRVWDPLREHLKGAKTVFVVPDGMLSLVSFAALPIGQAKYLIHEGPVIHYLSAERDLVSNPKPSTATRGLLAVGGAAFNDASVFARTSSRPFTPLAAKVNADDVLAQARSTSLETLRAGCGSLQTMQFTPLAGTRREVRDVAALWMAGSPAQVLEGRDASEQAFKREAPGHRVLHLATHGFFLGNDCTPAGAATRSVGALTTGQTKAASRPAQPNRPNAALAENPLLMSGLALAGANRRAAAGPDEDDGILTAEEVSALNLEGVEWAVLSACDTGLGEVKAGEGVFGLRRAFQVAGVRTVIMSLWPVDDQATRVWMRALYQGRLQQRLSTAEAMHNASLSVLRERRARHQSTHPFYWAAFVAAGDWR
jgi:CHAT domain-containing protein/tetratricopeptide (TPR) repeat protein